MKDSYSEFFSEFFKDSSERERFFNFGLARVITIPVEEAAKEWDRLKGLIISPEVNSEPIYIRSYGRNPDNNILYIDFYKRIFNKNVSIDKTNNTYPKFLIQKLTPYSRTIKNENNGKEKIVNYQISHVFGMTKNPFLFGAPWNIVFVPKIFDPFTGHEATGLYVKEFQTRFKQKIYKVFSDLIDNYNCIVREQKLADKKKDYLKKLNDDFDDIYGKTVTDKQRGKIIEQFSKDIDDQIREIDC